MPFFGHWYVLLLVVAFWAAVIAVVVLAIRYFVQSERPRSALNILEERFARGEIDQQEYEQRRAALKRQ